MALEDFFETEVETGKCKDLLAIYFLSIEIGKACIKKVLLSNCLQELMELHQETEEEVIDTEQAENWFSLTSAQRICDMFLALDKDMNGTLSKQELKEYADGTLTEIFIERGML
ncbi:hypothetical protein CCACVL1_12487 [Corchorus capsularis]|uniref:EF-hand domain-containing protein n=1 Tax=Corchorus capsularis TaxID=210143 RepID=A0A1R3IFF8_COCAP|nr:hypothetical protein CCACVL1_12487 [Corchorus capsularis]